jgi:CRISPR-associated exonuclease Cas4
MDINGTLINYYFHCKRQCWLHANRINLENEFELVDIGKAMHEIKFNNKKNSEIKIDNISIDKLTNDYVIEYKKSDADIEAAKWQLLFYLKVLKEKGIDRTGKLIFAEENKQNKKTIVVKLDKENENELLNIMKNINELIKGDIPEVKLIKGCKKCAFYEYCFL